MAIADQGIWSFSSFVLAIIVGRVLGPSGLANFSIGMAVITGIGSIYNSVIVAPVAHLLPTAYRADETNYATRLLRTTALTGTVFALAAVVIGLLVGSEGTLGAVIAALAAAPAVLLAWLARRVNYATGSPMGALVGTVLYTAIAIGGFVVLQLAGRFNIQSAFAALAIASLLQLISSAVSLKLRPFRALGSPPLGDIMRKHWGYGRWLLAAGIATWVGNEGYTVLMASAVVDLAAIGGLRAASNLTRSVGLFFEALNLLFVPRLSILWSEGQKESFLSSHSALRQGFVAIPLIATVLCAVWGENLLLLLYGPTFAGTGLVLTVLMGGMVLNGMAEADAIGLASVADTYGIFVAHAGRALSAPIIGLVAGIPFGIYGILAGYFVGQLVKAVVIRRAFLARMQAWDETPATPEERTTRVDPA